METYVGGRLPIEVKAAHDVLNIGAKFFPGVSLGDDVLAEGLGDVASVLFLGDFEYDFGHGDNHTMANRVSWLL
jgi:hypothetical protein